MGSLTPPWADELLARNTKIARKMMSSMSTESYFNSSFDQDQTQQQRNSPSPGFPQRSLTVDSDQSSSTVSSPTSSPSNHLISCNGESGKVVDPSLSSPASARMASSQSANSSTSCSSTSSSLPSPSSASSRSRRSKNTEKLSPIRNESFVEDDEESTKKSFEMTNGGEDLSILEYGPGIVKKLRSRYQSLALRQYSARPTLRRSASLENCLDAVSAEELAATLESKISNQNSNHLEDERNENINGRQHRGRNRFQNSSQAEKDSRTGSPATATTISEQQQNEQSVKQSSGGTGGGGGTPRGRTTGLDASARRDRMRRARSVDALHRTKREEEILEKFKHVVLPKEEIVIIEVSKPQEGSVINSAAVFNQVENGNNIGGATGEKRFPTRLLLTSNNFNNLRNSSAAANILDQQTANSVRNLMISPEHELPPHDIVRETARIFERNQENLNRRIGQALRLSKSQSVSADVGSQPLVPPASPTPSATTNNTSQQQKPVMAQSTTTSSAASGPMQPSQDKSFPTKTSSNNKVEANNATVNTNSAMANGPSHGQKQIGIIKPTLNNTTNGVINLNSKISNGGSGSVSVGSENRVRSPILSPIGLVSNHKPLIQHSHKPPLSPKPIFTSSPKVNNPGSGLAGTKGKAIPKDSPSTSPSPILIIDNNRSVSPFKSESPIPRVGSEIGRVRSPVSVSSKVVDTPPDSLEERREAFLRSPSPANGKTSPITTNGEGSTVSKRLEAPTNPIVTVKSKSPEEEKREFVVLKSVQNSNLHNGQSQVGSTDHHRQQVSREAPPPPPPRDSSPVSSTPAAVPTENSSVPVSGNKQVSQLRTHQKQKISQGGNGSMVFNFTNSRKAVPDYIEDDGLRRSSRPAGGDGRMDSMDDGFSSLDKDSVDSKLSLPLFEGGNVIINGKSSIQKRPKSQKLNISFNENATTTHEYPSESSLLIEDDPAENENLSPKKPNVISGSSLGSYTPKVGSNAYQLGSYSPFDSSSPAIINKKSNSGSKQDETDADFIEDYLKPNTESTTWSNEMSADILF